MHVSVFGLGYVGCVTAGCLADRGHHVVGVDVNPDKVAMVLAGSAPVIEPGLGDLLKRVVQDGRLTATTSATEAVSQTDLALICVGTPDRRTGEPNLDALSRVAADLCAALSGRTSRFTVVVRSTVLPGTVERLIAPALQPGSGEGPSRVAIAVNPEFMREGSSLQDFAHPPFIIVGAEDSATAAVVHSLYASVAAPFVHTTIRTAEMVKYVCNAFHALKICFANEVGDLCEALGADAHEVMRVFRLDKALNVSEAYLKPGFAFGGSCLPKDVRALVTSARRHDLPASLLSSILASNDRQVQRGVDAVMDAGRRRIGIVGLAFKPGTDDLRESPMVALVERLIGKGRDVRIFDADVSVARLVGANRDYIEREIPHIASLLCEDLMDLVAHSDVLVVSANSADTERALAAVRPDQTVIDLTRGGVVPVQRGVEWESQASLAS